MPAAGTILAIAAVAGVLIGAHAVVQETGKGVKWVGHKVARVIPHHKRPPAPPQPK